MASDWRYEFAAVKADGQLLIKSQGYYDRVLSTVGDGEPLILTLSKPVDRRSGQMNRALWGPIYDQIIAGLCENEGIELGDRTAKELMHEGLLQRFSGTVIDPVTKCEVAKERSSTMTIKRFGEFMEWIASYAAQEHGIVVTLPGEQ